MGKKSSLPAKNLVFGRKKAERCIAILEQMCYNDRKDRKTEG